METESDERIAFLDTMVHRDADGHLTTTVYRKPTHTDQYLAYDSHHPKSVKRGVVKCLYERASRIVSKPQCTATEKQHVAAALMTNGYPKSFVNRTSRKRRTTPEEPARFKSTVVLPYVDSISHLLRRRLEKHDIRVVFKSDTTLRNQLVHPKDPVLPDRRDGVVYKIPCSTCDKVYIGETGRPVGERMREHRRDVQHRRTDSSAVAEHAWNAEHHPGWDKISCVAHDKHWYTRRVKEAIQIRLHSNNINRDNGIDIPDVWLSAIQRHSRNRSEPVPNSAPPADTAGENLAPADWSTGNNSARPNAPADWSAARSHGRSLRVSPAPPAPILGGAQPSLCSLSSDEG